MTWFSNGTPNIHMLNAVPYFPPFWYHIQRDLTRHCHVLTLNDVWTPPTSIGRFYEMTDICMIWADFSHFEMIISTWLYMTSLLVVTLAFSACSRKSDTGFPFKVLSNKNATLVKSALSNYNTGRVHYTVNHYHYLMPTTFPVGQ